MIKLMKYEFRKAMLGKLLILVASVLGLIYNFIACKWLDETAMGISVMILTMIFMGSYVYFMMETIFVYNNDLKNKQGQLLLMVPRSTYQILGAKMIIGILSIAIGTVITGGAMGLGMLNIYISMNGLQEAWEMIQRVLDEFLGIQVTWSDLAEILLSYISYILLFMMLGVMSVTASRSVLSHSKLGGVAAVVLMLLLLWGESKLAGLFTIWWMVDLFHIAVIVVCFFASSWMLKHKINI